MNHKQNSTAPQYETRATLKQKSYIINMTLKYTGEHGTQLEVKHQTLTVFLYQ